MTWYIAICSLITGFCIGAIMMRWRSMESVDESIGELNKILIELNEAHNEQYKELFNT